MEFIPLNSNIVLTKRTQTLMRLSSLLGQYFLFFIASISTVAVLFIFYFITKDAVYFFKIEGFKEFFLTKDWYPSADNPHFGALAIFTGSMLVTLGSTIVSVPLGILAAVCLSDIVSFKLRQLIKPIIEILAAIPSVAYGFFALVIFAPFLQEKGGHILGIASLIIFGPLLFMFSIIISDLISEKVPEKYSKCLSRLFLCFNISLSIYFLMKLNIYLNGITISTGTNALNVSIILGIMSLPTVVSVSEDALHAVGRELREGSYALGATKAETILKVVIPSAVSGILAAVILGVMRALGETMVVWMASGNAAQIPDPIFNFLEPVRTLTATIAGDMGEADHVTGSSRYHVLFAMALVLLAFSFLANLVSEWVVTKQQKKLGK